MKVSSATIKNTRYEDKPNEDVAFYNEQKGIYIIMDGVSRDRENGKYPNPSPAYEVSKLFIEEAYSYLEKDIEWNNPEQSIKQAFQRGNEAIGKYNRSFLKSDFLPGTVGIIAIFHENMLYYGYIGDCIGILLGDGNKEEFTQCQTSEIHKHVKEYTAGYVRNEICNHIEHEYAYGVLDGRQGAMDFIVTGKRKIHGYRGCILATDGAKEILDEIDMDVAIDKSAKSVLDYGEISKNTDDKTLMLIRL